MSFVFCLKQNVRAFTIILGVTMKAVAFESWPEINGFVKKFVTFFSEMTNVQKTEDLWSKFSFQLLLIEIV